MREQVSGSQLIAAALGESPSRARTSRGLATACSCLSLLLAASSAAALESPETLWQERARGEWHLQMGGFSSHSRQTRAPGREWNETNPGLGLEHRSPGTPWDPDASVFSRWQSQYAVGTLEDSRQYWGTYVAAGTMYETVRTRGLAFHTGVSAALHYRSQNWQGRMGFTPLIAPSVSLTDRATGVGLNLLWIPRTSRVAGNDVGILFLQTTIRLPRM